jgi:hypothetical protein
MHSIALVFASIALPAACTCQDATVASRFVDSCGKPTERVRLEAF